jgi:hypothetical protein
MSDDIKWLKRAISDFKYDYCSKLRFDISNIMKYCYIFRKTNYICVCFRINREGSSSIKPLEGMQYSTIFSMLYISLDESLIDKDNNINMDGINFEFASFTSTYKSADGEYRHKLYLLIKLKLI